MDDAYLLEKKYQNITQRKWDYVNDIKVHCTAVQLNT